VRREANALANWSGVAERAESHGMAPLLSRHLATAGVRPPDDAHRTLQALVLRHRDANRIRREVLAEILRTFSAQGIEAVILKGAALSLLLYPDPGLRPMRDLDILVPPDRAREAQALLRDLGFDAPDTERNPYQTDHHHLPNATRRSGGLLMSVEVHHDALSRDRRAHLRLGDASLTDPPQPVAVEGVAARALGHHDMLRHLCFHTFQPAEEIRLISLVDTAGYAARFADEIDWERLQQQEPGLVHTVRMTHFIHPLPPPLAQRIGLPKGLPPQGVGQGMKPLSQIFRRRRRVQDVLRDFLYPSDWWLHVRYAVPNDRSLVGCRFLRHPAQIGYALARRTVSAGARRLRIR
jgi:hypothetical protein